MEDQVVKVVSDADECKSCFEADDNDRADEELRLVLLVGKDMIDSCAARRRLRFGLRDVPLHRLSGCLAPVDAAKIRLSCQPVQ